MGKRKEKRRVIQRLTENKKVIEERIELLNDIVVDMERTKGIPSIPLGGLFDDLLKLNPFRGEALIPNLLKEYETELEEVNQLIATQN